MNFLALNYGGNTNICVLSLLLNVVGYCCGLTYFLGGSGGEAVFMQIWVQSRDIRLMDLRDLNNCSQALKFIAPVIKMYNINVGVLLPKPTQDGCVFTLYITPYRDEQPHRDQQSIAEKLEALDTQQIIHVCKIYEFNFLM